MPEPEQIDSQQKESLQSTASQEGETQQKPPVDRLKNIKDIPDWRPLGTIRDYFSEQMKQDRFY